jgi:hypothetical protein
MSLSDESLYVAPTSRKRHPGLFKRGNNAYSARKRRLAKLTAQLSKDYEARSGAARSLIAVAAAALDQASRARSGVARARATRAATKALGLLERKPKRLNVTQILGLNRRA